MAKGRPRSTRYSGCVLRASGVTDKGNVRPANEDCFAVHEDLAAVPVNRSQGRGGLADQGFGAGFVPKVLDLNLVDRIETVSNDEAIAKSTGATSLRRAAAAFVQRLLRVGASIELL
jgi:hypothetical protein